MDQLRVPDCVHTHFLYYVTQVTLGLLSTWLNADVIGSSSQGVNDYGIHTRRQSYALTHANSLENCSLLYTAGD